MMEEYDEKLSQIEADEVSISNFIENIKRLKKCAKEEDNPEFVEKCDYELKILSLSERRPLSVNSNQALLVDYATDLELDRNDISGEQLDYYKKRLDDTNVSFLRYLYANFLYDYAKKGYGLNKYNAAKSLFKCIKVLLANSDVSTQKIELLLGRYLQIAIRMKDLDDEKWLLSKICQSIYEERFNVTNLVMYLEILSKAKVPVLTSNEQNIRIDAVIEKKMHSEKNAKNYQGFRNACEAKLHLIRLRNQLEELRNIQILIGDSYVDEVNGAELNSMKVAKLELAVQYFKEIGESGKVSEIKVALKLAYKKYDESGEIATLHEDVEFSTDELEQIEKQIKSFTDLEISDLFKAIVLSKVIMPDKEQIMKSAKEILKDNVLLSLISKSVIGYDRKIAVYTTEEQQLEYEFNKCYEISLKLTSLIYLGRIFEVKQENGDFNTESCIDFLREGQLIDARNIPIIEIGISRYFQNDFVSAIHILAPQFESTLRRLFENAGYPTTSLGSQQVQNEQTFNAFLNRSDVKRGLGENVHQLIKFVMVDKIGLNLRNNIGHGLMPIETMSKENCSLILYLFLIISMYGIKNAQ
ncbi:DUF4209 domain-containing protein [Levilactobacillus parabrevis]|uniref:DUF4209 domain-containing protein n=1 Tax=Levilactobacillus parabrevis TaxID=357278 RepID=UPI0021A90B40|nr:DUF4209 domain-containing protein [Levilactobacillus parabrevis]MCT4488793.1 DUF4209 domain-containing protein [Levilactobacillus parabrevis]MCT4490028.1 DUF4209 domain-containing protein [Levilactobacillus parabrevis]